MKKIITITALLLICFSCSKKEDDEPAPVPPSFIGKWIIDKQVSYNSDGTISGDGDFNASHPTCKSYLINNSDNTTVWVTFDVDCKETFRSFGNKFDGKNFDFPIPASDFKARITTLTATDLVFDASRGFPGAEFKRAYTFKLKRVQ